MNLNSMEDKTFKRAMITIALVIGIVYGFLALLNSRYVSSGNSPILVFDKWQREYIILKDGKALTTPFGKLDEFK